MRSFCVASVFALLLLGAGSARAESVKASCAHNAEAAQRLRDEGKPLAARSKLVLCARPACPAVVVARCARWLEDVDAAIPTVVIKARAGGADVTDVAVTIDGVHALDALDGRPLRLEPGEHAVHYTRASSPTIDQRVLVAAGEKNRLLVVDFTPRPPAPLANPEPTAAGPVAPTAATLPVEPTPSRAAVSPLAWVFGGVALAAAGSFAYFGVTGKSDLDALRAQCAGHCDDASVSAAWRKLVVADVSLGVGIVSLGAAAWLFLSPRRATSDAPAEAPGASSAIVVAPSPGGVALGWRGVF